MELDYMIFSFNILLWFWIQPSKGGINLGYEQTNIDNDEIYLRIS